MREERADEAVVLRVATRMLVEGEPLSMGRIARELRLGRRAVRSSFPSTDAMVEAIAVAVMHRLIGRYPALHPGSAEDDWRALMAAIWVDAALVRALLVAGQRRKDPALRDLLQPLLWSKAAIIARGQDEGCFRDDRSPDDLGAETQRLCLAALLEQGGTVETATDRTLAVLQR